MESPSPTVRRRAWINSSRQWLTLEELDPDGLPCSLPSASIADDDVFSDGCFTGKIENWLLGCGSEARSINAGQQSFESELKANFEDDLSLGADALEIKSGGITSGAGLAQHLPSKQGLSRLTCSTPRQELCLPSLHLGHSMASSCLSSSTCKTASSVSEVLRLCSEDAEETLYELGFGCEEPQVTARIPPRFFTFPSLVQGINFRLFLDSQLRRIREEDPSLTLASRFRQVQVLTAMANAFYSLYSHVSRTPLQKLATPEFTFSSSPVERIERFRSSIRSEPRSPVERLKDTVSKMCLYTGSPRGSDSASPQPSPRKRSSLPDVVAIILEKDKTGAAKKLDLGQHNRSNSAMDDPPVTNGDESSKSAAEQQTQQAAADADGFQNEICREENQGSKQTDNSDAEGNCVKPTELSLTHIVGTSLGSSLSGETVMETDHQFFSYQPELDSHTAQRATNLKPVAKVTYDLICPQIVESIHWTAFCTHNPETATVPLICSVTESTDRSRPGTRKPHKQTAISGPGEDSHTGHVTRQCDASRSPPVLAVEGSCAECCITVTGWEGDDVPCCPWNAPDSSHTSAVPPVPTRVKSFNGGKSRYLNPLTHQGPGPVTSSRPQVNSFELEEVHSAGEEDFGQSETTGTTTNLYKGEVARGDSMQSDSSGYAEEEASPSSGTHSR